MSVTSCREVQILTHFCTSCMHFPTKTTKAMREVRISASFCTSRINIGVARLRGDTGVRLRGDTGVRLRGDMVYACGAVWVCACSAERDYMLWAICFASGMRFLSSAMRLVSLGWVLRKSLPPEPSADILVQKSRELVES